ncbi:MAG: PilT/PilU family type 4a pilus ATPase [Candidatus Krumholzibacteriia bacterium]
MNMHDVMEEAIALQASDIMISAEAPITYNVFGVLEKTQNWPVMTGETTRELVYQILDEKQRRELETNWELDLGYELPGRSRFRASVFFQRGTVACVMRVVPLAIPHYSEIGISDRLLLQLVSIPNGLLLVTGPTGSGKSTTIASILDYMNTDGDMPKHIVTIEDPIEYDLKSQVCHIDQREIGIDTKGYQQGLKGALRQMPHVIFVGEMRDRETMEIALTAAETGNFVISTLSTQSASKTINRIIDVFPLHDQAEVRARLALTLRGVLSQVLLRRKDRPGRIAAREIMFATNAVSNLIRENKVHQVDNMIASGYAQGMVLMDDALMELHEQGLVYTTDVIPRLRDPDKARGLIQR